MGRNCCVVGCNVNDLLILVDYGLMLIKKLPLLLWELPSIYVYVNSVNVEYGGRIGPFFASPRPYLKTNTVEGEKSPSAKRALPFMLISLCVPQSLANEQSVEHTVYMCTVHTCSVHTEITDKARCG